MRKVCLFNFPVRSPLEGYQIESLDPMSYFAPREHSEYSDVVRRGTTHFFHQTKLYTAEGIDRLYRERNSSYMRFIDDFVDRFHDADALIFANYCPVHPEVLAGRLRGPRRILGFIDDPFSTYVRGIPFLWAVDGAFYISPSYDETSLFSEKLPQWGCDTSRFWALRPFPEAPADATDAFFADRDVDLLYVGKAYGPKIDRLVALKRRFGSRFHVHGQWPFRGLHGFVRALQGKPVFPHRVRPLSDEARTSLYRRAKIGFNMHLSDRPRETGNMRMYEVPANGALLLCDKAGRDAHAQIFEPGVEAVFYDSIDEAMELIDHYLADEPARLRIARAGFARLERDYAWDANLRSLLDWACSVPRRTTLVR